MLECADCGVMVIIPVRHGVCVQCFAAYRLRPVTAATASSRERVMGASDLNFARSED